MDCLRCDSARWLRRRPRPPPHEAAPQDCGFHTAAPRARSRLRVRNGEVAFPHLALDRAHPLTAPHLLDLLGSQFLFPLLALQVLDLRLALVSHGFLLL